MSESNIVDLEVILAERTNEIVYNKLTQVMLTLETDDT